MISNFKKKPKPNGEKVKSPQLSALARHVYEGAPMDVQFEHNAGQVAGKPDASAQATPTQVNATAHAQNFTPKVPTTTPTSSRETMPVISIQRPNDFRREDYIALPDSPKRRKLNSTTREAEVALRQRTQREQGDTAVYSFQNTLLSIFEEHSRVADETQDQSAILASGFFEPAGDDDDFAIQFSTNMLESLHSKLKSLVDLKRLDDISDEHIKMLRQLCDGPAQKAQTLNLRLHQDVSSEEVESWLERIRIAEIGAASASIILLTALGNKSSSIASETLQAIPGVLVNIFESCLIPIVEARPDGQSAELFRAATVNMQPIKKLLDTSRKLLDQLASASIEIQEARSCVNSTEFLAAKLIFVQNAPTDKNAALGAKTFERTRKNVMATLARLFAAYVGDRRPILDEVLSSVDKLPSTSRSARQYTLGDGKSVMLITALLMQLVQTSALSINRRSTQVPKRRGKRVKLNNEEDDSGDSEAEADTMDVDSEEDQDEVSRLRRKADELYSSAMYTSREIVRYLVGKASKVSKTGDSPYRNILDLFIEDLVALLPLPDWPASQLVLELLGREMSTLAENEKAAGVKNMALESLGTMGAAIAGCKATAEAQASALSRDVESLSATGRALSILANDFFSRALAREELMGSHGPFALTCQYHEMQQSRKDTRSLRARSAQSFYLAQYGMVFCRTAGEEPANGWDQTTRNEAFDISEAISEASAEFAARRYSEPLQPREAHLAYLLSILSLPFCRRYPQIGQILLATLSSDQAQVRSRSIKSVVTMLETDASLLDSQDMSIEKYIFPCASDDSALVRDAALSLIAKFLISKPAYEQRGIQKLIECTRDDKVGVQKRSIGHLAEIYESDNRPKLKAWIAATFLYRTADPENTVSELAKRTLADAWFTPNGKYAEEPRDSARANVAIQELTDLIVATLQRELLELPPLLSKFVASHLKTTKSAVQLGALLGRIVENLFNGVVAGNASEASLLLLVCMSHARPESVAPGQLAHLRQYLENIKAEEELPTFKAVIKIFQNVLPGLSNSQEDLLERILLDLLNSITRLGMRSDLDDVMSCIRTITDVLQKHGRLSRLLTSMINGLQKADTEPKKRQRLILLLGSLGKRIDVDKLSIQDVKGFKTGPVSGFIVDILFPYAAGMVEVSEEMRFTALESLGCVCQAWPAQFNKKPVKSLFYDCLGMSDGSALRRCALRTFQSMFESLGEPIEDGADKDKAEVEPVQDLKKMGGSAKVQGDSSAISSIATHVFERIKRIALAMPGPDLLVAAQTVASMSRRGTFHPKDYAGVFIALETSSSAEVRAVAEAAHRKAHTQHESHWEREYMHAINTAFKYQQTVGDLGGARQGRAKLGDCFSILNTSGSKYVKKFLSNLISRLSTDASKLSASQTVPDHVLFVQFVTQNLAFFEYTRMEDLLHTILQLELLFSKNGAEISETIETTLPIQDMVETPKEDAAEAKENLEPKPEEADEQVKAEVLGGSAITAPLLPDVSDLDQLRRLTAAACAVTMISETRSHLKRQYGINHDIKATMQQSKVNKDNTKAPNKVHGISGDRFYYNTTNVLKSLDSPEAMLRRCRDFHRLMSIDEDVLVGEEVDEVVEGHAGGAFIEAGLQGGDAAPRGRKRKGSVPGSAGGTPRKRGRPRKNATPGRRSSSASSREDPDADFEG
jgi:cohesin loading factor subunit SCC2